MSKTLGDVLVKRSSFLELREKLNLLYRVRESMKQFKTDERKFQSDILAFMSILAPDGSPVSFDVDGVGYAAKLMTNKGADTWDVANLVEWLKQNPTLWRKVSTTVLDPAKLDAEISAGNVKREDVAPFVIPGNESASYIKFVNVTPDSL
jgi:hypothetical protein